MQIFGKKLSEYVAFSKLFLGLIVVVWILRLALSLGGVPNSTGKWISVTGALLVGVLYYSVQVHTSGFGSYKQLLPIFWVLCLASQVLIAAAVALAIFTGRDNIFTAPEYSGGGDGKNWAHVGAHLVLGAVVAPLVFWLIGSLIMFVTKKLVPKAKDTGTAMPATHGGKI
jgi:hypothetical protein